MRLRDLFSKKEEPKEQRKIQISELAELIRCSIPDGLVKGDSIKIQMNMYVHVNEDGTLELRSDNRFTIDLDFFLDSKKWSN